MKIAPLGEEIIKVLRENPAGLTVPEIKNMTSSISEDSIRTMLCHLLRYKKVISEDLDINKKSELIRDGKNAYFLRKKYLLMTN